MWEGGKGWNCISAELGSWGRGQEVREVVDRVQHLDSPVNKVV